jgi:hypothetical protein
VRIAGGQSNSWGTGDEFCIENTLAPVARREIDANRGLRSKLPEERNTWSKAAGFATKSDDVVISLLTI